VSWPVSVAPKGGLTSARTCFPLRKPSEGVEFALEAAFPGQSQIKDLFAWRPHLNDEAMVTHASSVVRRASSTSKQNQGLDDRLAWQMGPAADRRIGVAKAAQADALGYPATAVIFYAVDYDATVRR
jgi:hypothetical protein